MPESNSTNPYEPPRSVENPAAVTPGPGAIVIYVVVGLLFGGIVFLGTCFGSAIIAFNYTYRSQNADTVFGFVWGGSILLGILTAIFVGRKMYARAVKRVAVEAADEPEEKNT